MTRIRLVKKTFFAANRVMILVVIFAALLEYCLASSLGSKCQHDMDCTDFIKGSTCSMNGYCECAPYFVQYNVTTCLSSQLLGGDCILADQCTMKVANSSCLDGACRCVEGFLQFRKHTCLGPAHPGAVCYSHAHCQMNDRRSHCDFLIPNLFGRCQCTSPAKQYGGMCIESDSSVEADAVLSQTTTYTPLITPPPTVFRPIDLISHYELSTQGHPLLINNNEISLPSSSTENQVEFTKLPELSVSSSSEQAGGEDLTADTEALDVLNNYHITNPSTQEPAIDLSHQVVTSDDYPYKIDSEDQTSINEEESEQVEENPQLPVIPAEETVLIPNEETNDIIKLDNVTQVQKETEAEVKPESEHLPEIQFSTETVLVPDVEQESNEEQHSETEKEKPEEEIQPEEEKVTEISAEIEHIPEIHQENEVEQEEDSQNSEAAKPEAVSVAELSHVFEQVEEHKEEHENIPDKTEFEDNINYSEESIASPENSEEKIDLTEPEKVDEAPTEQPAEDIQTPNPIESIDQELHYEEHLAGQEVSTLLENVLPEENLSQSSQEPLEPSNLEPEEIKDDPTEKPIESNYDLEQEHQHQVSAEKDEESAESAGGGQMEESHYRPSSDVHSQEEAAVADEEVETNIDMIGEMIPTSSPEHKETPIVQEESEIGSGDISQSPNIEIEDEAPQTNYGQDQNVSETDQAQSEFEVHENPTQANDIVEDIQEGNVQEQVPHETNSQSNEESQQIAEEAHQEENIQEQHPQLTNSEHSTDIEKEAAEPSQEGNVQEQVPLETIAEESTEEIQNAEEGAQEENQEVKIQDEQIAEEENKDETHQVQDNDKVNEENWHLTEIEDEKNKEGDNQSESNIQDLSQIQEVISSLDQTEPSLGEEIKPAEANVSEQITEDKIPEVNEENYQTNSEEEIKVNKVDQEENNSPISLLEGGDLVQVHEDTHSSSENLGQQIVGEEQQEVAQGEPHKAAQETIEELLQVAAQALAEKGTQQMNTDQNKDEIHSITEKPILESEEESLQTLQEEELEPAVLDDLIFMPANASVLPEENKQENEESTPKSTEEEYSLPSKESESEGEHTNPIEQKVVPEIITEAVETELQEVLPEKVIQISSAEDQGQAQNTDLSTETVLQNDPLEELPAETEEIVENESLSISLGEQLQGEHLKEPQNNILESAQESTSESEVPQIVLDTHEEEHASESIVNAEPSRLEDQELVSKPDLTDITAPIDPEDIHLDQAVSLENKLSASEESPTPAEKEEEIKEAMLENESLNEAIQQVHDLENIIEGAEPSNIAHDNNPLNSFETLPSKILTSEANEGDETLALDENPISSDENTISESNEKIESDNALGQHPENKPIVDEVKDIYIDVDKIKENEEELLENDQATTVRSESEQNSDHEPLVHPTFELEETQQKVIENVNDKLATHIEESNETQSGANANESEPATTEYVPLVIAESETLATPVAAATVVEPEISEIEKFEQFEDNHLLNEPLEVDNDNEENLSEEAAATTISPLNLETSQIIEENIENDFKASGDTEFNENESVLSILSGLIENEEEGSGTPLPEISIDDLKAEETVHNEQTPSTGSYYPSVLSDLLLSTKSEVISNDKPTTSGPLNDNIENVTPEELPFDLSFVSPNDHEELMSDNLVVETTPSAYPESSSEDSITTEVPDILEITTQTMLGLASRVTLMEPAAPIATTLKPFMTMEEDFSTTSSSLNIDSLITSKPVRKRVELGNGPVSLGLNCNNDKQCQLADPNTVCSDQGICDCESKTTTDKCSAERTGCSAGTFQCRSSGVCISWFFVCDGRPDCTDASDEECTFNARLNQTCPTESFRCEHSGRCISRAALCDGRKQCPHGEDEIECDSLRTEGGQCPPNTFRCNSGECLPEYEYCNAIISCKDGSDEPPHLCGSRSVPNIFLRLLTAAVVDDGSAKSSRGGINAYCPHRCSNGRCRSTAIVCSGRDGCGDGTDEETCSVCRCPAPAYASSPAQFLARQPPMPLWK